MYPLKRIYFLAHIEDQAQQDIYIRQLSKESTSIMGYQRQLNWCTNITAIYAMFENK
jgi:hypothetical protein